MALQSVLAGLSAFAVLEVASSAATCAERDPHCHHAEEGEEAVLLQSHRSRFGPWVKHAPPRSALMVIDMQYDFINGSLAVPDAESIIPTVNALTALKGWNAVIFTRDYHPWNHISFASNHKGAEDFSTVNLTYTHDRQLCTPENYIDPSSVNCSEDQVRYSLTQELWPDHCIQGTWGCKIPADVMIPAHSVEVLKGITVQTDSYGAFENNLQFDETNTEHLLRSSKVENVYVVGLAKDYCVKYTALQAEERKFNTYVVADAIKPVHEETGNRAEEELLAAGVELIDSSELLQGKAGPPPSRAEVGVQAGPRRRNRRAEVGVQAGPRRRKRK